MEHVTIYMMLVLQVLETELIERNELGSNIVLSLKQSLQNML